MKYNLSEIMKRAWELIKKAGMTLSSGLKKAWKEAKNMEKTVEEKTKEKIEELTKNLETMLYGNIYINLGIEREINAKKWEKEDKKRTYLSIACYTAARRYKGSYKAGYVDMTTGEYVCTKYDDVNAETAEYIGR